MTGTATVFNTNDLAPAISGDGRYIAFSSRFGFNINDIDNLEDIYVYDALTRGFTLVSNPNLIAQADTPELGASFRPTIATNPFDPNHFRVAFEASDAAGANGNKLKDIFLFDSELQSISRISAGINAGQATTEFLPSKRHRLEMMATSIKP